MAKTLRTTTPSSSVARLLDPVAAAQAIERVSGCGFGDIDPATMPLLPTAKTSVSSSNSRPPKREIVLTPETDAVLDQLVELYRRSTRTRLTTSHVIRAMLLAARETMAALAAELARVGPLRLPNNAPARHAQRQQFEAVLARAFANAMRQPTFRDP